jgi:hypothetical protein
MDDFDFESWPAERAPADFAKRTAQAMLAASSEPPDDQRSDRPAVRLGRFGALLLAAALVASTAWAMHSARAVGTPPSMPPTQVDLELPAIAVPAAAPVATVEEVLQIEETVIGRTPRTAPTPPAATVTPRSTPDRVYQPRCDCSGDVMVCGCIEP